MDIFVARRKEMLLLILLIITAFIVRIDRVEEFTPGMYADELTVAKAGLQLLAQSELPPYADVNFGHPTPLLYATGLSVQTFGHTITAIRLPYIIFGALSVGAFYILLRLFFPTSIAFLGSLLMVYQYSHVALSRLAYEPIPSLFWQIVTITFLVLYWSIVRIYSSWGLVFP